MKRWLIRYLTHHLLATINTDDVLRLDQQGHGYLKGKKIEGDSLEALRDQAEVLKKSYLWEVLHNNSRYAAHEQMFDKAKTYDDIVFGKGMLYGLDLLRQVIERISTLR